MEIVERARKRNARTQQPLKNERDNGSQLQTPREPTKEYEFYQNARVMIYTLLSKQWKINL